MYGAGYKAQGLSGHRGRERVKGTRRQVQVTMPYGAKPCLYSAVEEGILLGPNIT